MLRRLIAAAALSAVVALTGSVHAQTVTFAHTDIEGLEELQRQFGAFRDTLSETTGLDVKFYPVSSRSVAIEALRANRVDFALSGPSEYVIARSQMVVEPIIGFSRVDYFTSLVVLKKSGIKTVQDMVGKRLGMCEVGSTSCHLGPFQMLSDLGINPREQIKSVFVGSTNTAWEALKKGSTDIWAVSNATFVRLRANEKDFQPTDFSIIERGPDLPGDLILASGNVKPEIIAKVRAAFADPEKAAKLKKALLSTPNGQASYGDVGFVANASDADYAYIRKAFAAIGEPQLAKVAPK